MKFELCIPYQNRNYRTHLCPSKRNSSDSFVTMQSTEATFVPSRSADIKLHTRQWVPLDKEPAAVILFLHGFCDYLHGNDDDCPPASYHARAKRFVDWGAACVGIEQEGHGLSSGSRAYIRHLDDFINDTFDYLSREVITRWPDTPVFFFGESMGGAMAIMLSLREDLPPQVKGMILMAPMVMIHPSMMPPKAVVNMLRKINKSHPKAKIVPGGSKKLLKKTVRDKSILERVKADPYIYKDTHRVGTAVALLDATTYIAGHMEKITMPMLVLHGQADTVTSPEFSEILVKRASSEDKTVKIYDDMWHAIFSEEAWSDVVFPDIFDWLDSRARADAAT